MNDLLLQQIEKITIIKHNRDLFRTLCGLEIEIRRTDGSPITDTDTPKQSKKNKKTTNLSCTCDGSTPNCNSIKEDILDQLMDDHKTQTFICSAGLQKILIPIVVKDDVVGLVFTGENTGFRFQGDQYKTITKILEELTQYVVKNELTPLEINMYASNELTRQQELLNRAIKYIKQNYHSNDLTLREVSINNGISYHYLSRIFKKELDTTFAQYRNQVRMDAAKKMLKNRRLSISQISYACGFDDPAYFCKVFKNSFGSSPTNFRLGTTSTSRI